MRLAGYIYLLSTFFAGLFSCHPPAYGPEIKGKITTELNPYGFTPLSAKLTFETSIPCFVQYDILGTAPFSRRMDRLRKYHQVTVIGLYPDSRNQVLITTGDQSGRTDTAMVEIRTDPLPSYFPDIEIHTSVPGQMEPGWTLVDFQRGVSGRYVSTPFVFDQEGTIRWAAELSFYPKIVWAVQRTTEGLWAFACRNHLYMMDDLGHIAEDIDIDGFSIEHDFLVLPDGHILAGANKYGTDIEKDHQLLPSHSDFVIEVDPRSRKVIHEWDLRNMLDVDRTDFFEQPENPGDWFHINSVWYDAPTGQIIVSGRNQGVLSMSREGSLNWILAPHQGWGRSGMRGQGNPTAPFLLTAVDHHLRPLGTNVQMGLSSHEDFDWPWGQHTPKILKNGNLLMFDNGMLRRFQSDLQFSRAVEYEIDNHSKTIRQVWSHPPDNSGPYSNIVSDVDELSQTGNRLITFGSIRNAGNPRSEIIEIIRKSQDTVYHASLLFKDLSGSGKEIWGQFDLVYRSERVLID